MTKTATQELAISILADAQRHQVEPNAEFIAKVAGLLSPARQAAILAEINIMLAVK